MEYIEWAGILVGAMMRIKFPTKRSDGSFCIEIKLRVNAGEYTELADRVVSWSDRWIEENRFWSTSLAESVGGRLDFLEDFTGPPACSATHSSLLLRFESRRAASKWWKDWLVLRFLKDLQTAFNEISVESIGDCTGR